MANVEEPKGSVCL